jgi:hypothetical protein
MQLNLSTVGLCAYTNRCQRAPIATESWATDAMIRSIAEDRTRNLWALPVMNFWINLSAIVYSGRLVGSVRFVAIRQDGNIVNGHK